MSEKNNRVHYPVYWYKRLNKTSDVVKYRIGDDYVVIRFSRNDDLYVYDYQNTGKDRVEKMKSLIEEGSGLSRFIHSDNLFDEYSYIIKADEIERFHWLVWFGVSDHTYLLSDFEPLTI